MPPAGVSAISASRTGKPAARSGRFPAQREYGGVTAVHRIQQAHLDQLGQTRRGAQRAHPYQASQAPESGRKDCLDRPGGSGILDDVVCVGDLGQLEVARDKARVRRSGARRQPPQRGVGVNEPVVTVMSRIQSDSGCQMVGSQCTPMLAT
jgi:hypothetical protein